MFGWLNDVLNLEIFNDFRYILKESDDFNIFKRIFNFNFLISELH